MTVSCKLRCCLVNLLTERSVQVDKNPEVPTSSPVFNLLD